MSESLEKEAELLRQITEGTMTFEDAVQQLVVDGWPELFAREVLSGSPDFLET